MVQLVSQFLALPALLAGLVVWGLVARSTLANVHGVAAFLFTALSIRYLLNFFHAYTTSPIMAGQSVNSFFTLAVALIGLFLVRDQLLRTKALLPVYAFTVVLLISGMMNGGLVGTVNAVLRECLFIGVMLAIVSALDVEKGDGKFSSAMLAIFAAPLFYQLYTIVTLDPKPTEGDASVSFVGGYVHEGVFSTMILTALTVVVLVPGFGWRKRLLLVGVLFVSLVLANYRTSVLAALPMVGLYLIFGLAKQFRSDLGGLIRVASFIGCIAITAALVSLLGERMADIDVLLNGVGDIIRPTAEFTDADMDLFSGRAYVWSQHVFTTLNADISHLMFGFGPDAWEGVFQIYAHNVFVSFFYEVGVVGLAVFVGMLLYFFWLALRARPDKRWTLVGGHLSYLMLCLGTMPTWTVEGVIYYAVLCGFTLYYNLAPRSRSSYLVPSNREFASRLYLGGARLT